MSKRTNKPDILTKKTIAAFLDEFGSDGWSIVTTEWLEKEYGFPRSFLESISRKHVSNPKEHKETIYDPATGKPLKSLVGCHTLTVLMKIAVLTGVIDKAESKMGRGSQARAYTQAIRDHYLNQ